MTQSKYYVCNYCHTEYIPKRRGVQKYCSNSCRSNACRVRNSEINKLDSIKPTNTKISNKSANQMSLAGVGNATTGALLADGLKALFTSADNTAATKGDLKLLTEKLLGRYHLVKNIPLNINGEQPYYDMVNKVVVYFK